MWNPEQPVLISIVDDHPIVMQGLISLMEGNEQLLIRGTFTRASDFLSFLEEEDVHIVLLDVMLPDVNGLDLCLEIKKRKPKVLVLMISNHAERSMMIQSLKNGASGYLLKNASLEDLMQAIEQALSGQAAFSREVLEIIGKPDLSEIKKRPRLTKREKQVLQLISEGKTTADIAEELFVSPLTVETHRRNLIQKFQVRNAAELITESIKQGFLLNRKA